MNLRVCNPAFKTLPAIALGERQITVVDELAARVMHNEYLRHQGRSPRLRKCSTRNASVNLTA